MAGRRYHVVEAVKLAIVRVVGLAQVGSNLNEHAQILPFGGKTLRGASDLVADKFVVRQVVIECANHGVAVLICPLSNCVVLLVCSKTLAKPSASTSSGSGGRPIRSK